MSANMRLLFLLVLLLASTLAFAAVGPRGLTIREGVIYVSPDTTSAKLSNISRGREVVVHPMGCASLTTRIASAMFNVDGNEMSR